MNIYQEYYKKYLEKGLSVIPDVYGSKAAAEKGWTAFAGRCPTEAEATAWADSYSSSNISLMLGKVSGVIALDIDAKDQRVLDIIMPLLPESPVIKKGEKGETRFFKYFSEETTDLKFNGDMVLEVLSTGKKTTLPPSKHPVGLHYKWISENNLLDFDLSKLPMLPPTLIPILELELKKAIPDAESGNFGRVSSGRNAVMTTFVASLINKNVNVDDALAQMIAKDRQENEIALFTDFNEFNCTDAVSNALQFYSNHLSSINRKKFQKKEAYLTPIVKGIEVGKPQGAVRSLAVPSVVQNFLPEAKDALGDVIKNIKENMYVVQPQFAYAAALTLFATLTSRKMLFSDISPNIYTLILGLSGSGKNMPLQYVKRMLIDINAEDLIGSGDFVSDASLIDSLSTKPVRCDIVDEASKLLSVANNNKNSFDGKIADILCELYTSSNDKFLGRAMASQDGTMRIRGACYRPNVNMIAGTTPSGFSHAVTPKSLEKGLLGRFLIFLGERGEERLNSTRTPLNKDAIEKLIYLNEFTSSKSSVNIQGMSQNLYEIPIQPDAKVLLEQIFKEFNERRRALSASDAMLPVAARLYQQMIKLIILHTCGRYRNEIYIDCDDVYFGQSLIMHCYNNFHTVVDSYLFNNYTEKYTKALLGVIREAGQISAASLIQKTMALSNKERDEALKTLESAGLITKDVVTTDSYREIVWRTNA